MTPFYSDAEKTSLDYQNVDEYFIGTDGSIGGILTSNVTICNRELHLNVTRSIFVPSDNQLTIACEADLNLFENRGIVVQGMNFLLYQMSNSFEQISFITVKN